MFHYEYITFINLEDIQQQNGYKFSDFQDILQFLGYLLKPNRLMLIVLKTFYLIIKLLCYHILILVLENIFILCDQKY
jgi:hypothetical protein